jgi:DNA-binding transcriptional MerR regulator
MSISDSSLFAYSDDHSRKEKAPNALRTISEASEMLDVPQHVLRFWETKFNQIKPLKRNGGRRFYRPQDLDILQQIKHLLYAQGYTIKGAKKAIDDFAHAKSSEWLNNMPPANVNDNTTPNMAHDPLAEIASALAEPEEKPAAVASASQYEALRGLRAELLAMRKTLAASLKEAA